MITPEEAKTMSEDDLLKRQKKGAVITASIVGGIAFGIFMLTLYLNR